MLWKSYEVCATATTSPAITMGSGTDYSMRPCSDSSENPFIYVKHWHMHDLALRKMEKVSTEVPWEICNLH